MTGLDWTWGDEEYEWEVWMEEKEGFLERLSDEIRRVSAEGASSSSLFLGDW